jgi:hypothetical protein
MRVGITSPTHTGQPKTRAPTFPMAIPTHPRMNMFMKTCHPASHPLRSSAPRPAEAHDLPLGLGVGQGAPEDAGRHEGADGRPRREEGVPEPPVPVGVDDPRHPHGGVGGGVGAEDRRGREPPREPPPRQEEVGLGPPGQAVEEERPPHHEEKERRRPEPVQGVEADQWTLHAGESGPGPRRREPLPGTHEPTEGPRGRQQTPG